uniref:Uncharacterized protein n=1 Tax=Rhizophora mucronata TaxID=61149 RepID=A0A2P2QCM4_RHIMU
MILSFSCNFSVECLSC